MRKFVTSMSPMLSRRSTPSIQSRIPARKQLVMLRVFLISRIIIWEGAVYIRTIWAGIDFRSQHPSCLADDRKCVWREEIVGKHPHSPELCGWLNFQYPSSWDPYSRSWACWKWVRGTSSQQVPVAWLDTELSRAAVALSWAPACLVLISTRRSSSLRIVRNFFLSIGWAWARTIDGC
jgi:hypothetical protein